MARYTEEELRRLKEEVDLAALVGAAGVELKSVGADLRGRCPFHDDKGPSLVVTPGKNLWHCLGACGAGGSVIDWVMKSQGLSFRHAVELLRADHRAACLAPARAAKISSVRRLPPPVPLDADDRQILHRVVAFYHETLKRERTALEYLAGRGLTHPEMVDRFKLGYANRTLGYRLPEKSRKDGAEIRGRLEKLGIYRPSGHEHFSGSFTIPILDPAGTVLGIYGRKVGNTHRPGTPKHLYLPGPHRGVWNEEVLSASREIILCEALIDGLTFWGAGFRNVTASYGVHGFTADHLEAFRKYGTRKVFIAYDRDDAGDRAAAELAPRLAQAGIEVWRILFPRGMDANDYARKVTPASSSLSLVVRSAQFVRDAKSGGARPSEAPPVDPSSAPASSPAHQGEPENPVPPPAEASLPVPSTAIASGAAAAPVAFQPPEEPPPLAASEATAPPLVVSGDEATLALGDREYRVRGLGKNLSYAELRVNVRARRGEKVHVDTFDLLSARPRAHFAKEAADELGVALEVAKRDLGRLLLELEALQDRRIKEALQPKPKEVALSDAEKAEALELLRDPGLLGRLAGDFEKIGLVGERTNTLVSYLAAVSRKMEEPLAVLVQSNSAAGKSALMDAVLELCPPEDVERYTAMTGQSLYYMAEANLKHKILSIAEVEGALRAGYAIKMLQSEGRISIATTVKDPETGEMKTRRHDVEGPVAVMLTTTAAEIDPELQNRAVVLTVNEDREQTRAIHERQRRAQTLGGMLAREDRQAVLRVHRNAQRLLRPLLVVNPFAPRLTFQDTRLRTRRDHVKYLTLIRAVAFLHQYQRPIREVEHRGKRIGYIEVTVEDLKTANALAAEVLGRSLDELAPHTRRLLLALGEMVAERCRARSVERADVRFSRRDAREWTKWGDTQLRVHLERLVDLEYVLVHRGARGQSFVYELLWDGRGTEGERFLVGLLDPEALSRAYESEVAGEKGEFAGSSRPHRGASAGGLRGAESAVNAAGEPGRAETRESAAEKDRYRETTSQAVVHTLPVASKSRGG